MTRTISDGFRKKEDAAFVAAELSQSTSFLSIAVLPLKYDRRKKRWWVTVESSKGAFDDFDRGYVLAFLTAWRVAKEGP